MDPAGRRPSDRVRVPGHRGQRPARLLPICAEALSGLSWHVVLAVGDALDDETAAALPPEFEVRRWVPYADVLRHADVFVSQAGMGSIMQAAGTRRRSSSCRTSRSSGSTPTGSPSSASAAASTRTA